MRISANVNLTERKIQIVSRLEGVDMRKGESLYKADKSLNLINKNGKIVKRNGWIERIKFDNRVDFFAPVVLNEESFLLVYSNKHFYLANKKGNITDITASASQEYSFSQDKLLARSIKLVRKSNLYFIYGAGVYLVLGSFNRKIELRAVEKMAYIPITTIGIMPEAQCIYLKDLSVDETSRGVWFVKNGNTYESTVLSDDSPFDPTKTYYNRVSSASLPPTKLESANILTPFRRNTLLGVSGESVYQLDSGVVVDDKNQIIIKAKESSDVNVYKLHARRNYNTARYIEESDDLDGKTITVTANTEVVSCYGLQQGIDVKGKVLFKGENIECFWCSTGITELGWSNAKLKVVYLDENQTQKEEIIATATRKTLNSPYGITYQEKTLKLFDGASNKITFSCVHGESDKYIKAVLPSYNTPLVDQSQQVWGNFDHKNGRITLTRSAVSPDGSDNIEVTFKCAENEYSTDTINGCTICSEFGVDGNTDRVFVSGNPLYPNRDFATDSENLTYFPVDYIYKFGFDSTPVTGYARLSDDSQAIFKSAGQGESNVYIRKGRWVTSTVSIGESTYTFNKAEFYLSGNYLSTTPVSNETVSYMDGEPFFMSRNGVCSLKTSLDLLDNRKSVVDRGACVNDFITQNIPEVHNAITVDGNYCLSVGDKLFIAKSGSYFYENKIKQYNWWVFDNIPAVTLAKIKGELWFATSDGRICSFSLGFYDTYYDKIAKGSILFEANSKIVSFSENLALELGREIILNEKLYSLFLDNVRVENGKICVEDVSGISNFRVYADKVSSSGLSCGVEYSISDIDYKNNTFSLTKDGSIVELKSGGFRLSFLLENQKIKVSKLRYSLDKTQNDLCEFEYMGKNVIPITYNDSPLPESFDGNIVRETPVVALWKTSKTDLNNPTKLKTVHKVGLTFGERTEGVIKLVCESKSSIVGRINFGEGINLLNPNIAGFSFNGATNKECYARTRFREVGYFDLTIVSEDAKPFELKGFSIEYSVLKGKRGIY